MHRFGVCKKAQLKFQCHFNPFIITFNQTATSYTQLLGKNNFCFHTTSGMEEIFGSTDSVCEKKIIITMNLSILFHFSSVIPFMSSFCNCLQCCKQGELWVCKSFVGDGTVIQRKRYISPCSRHESDRIAWISVEGVKSGSKSIGRISGMQINVFFFFFPLLSHKFFK